MDDEKFIQLVNMNNFIADREVPQLRRVMHKAREQGFQQDPLSILIEAGYQTPKMRAKIEKALKMEPSGEEPKMEMPDRKKLRRIKQLEEMRDALDNPKIAADHAGCEVIAPGLPGVGWYYILGIGTVAFAMVVFLVTFSMLAPATTEDPGTTDIVETPTPDTNPDTTPDTTPGTTSDTTPGTPVELGDTQIERDSPYNVFGLRFVQYSDSERSLFKVGDSSFVFDNDIDAEEWLARSGKVASIDEKIAWARAGLSFFSDEELLARALAALQKVLAKRDPMLSLKAFEMLRALESAPAELMANAYIEAANLMDETLTSDKTKACSYARRALDLAGETELVRTRAEAVLTRYGSSPESLPQPDMRPNAPEGYTEAVVSIDGAIGPADGWYGKVRDDIDPGRSSEAIESITGRGFAGIDSKSKTSRVVLNVHQPSKAGKYIAKFNCYPNGKTRIYLIAVFYGEAGVDYVFKPVDDISSGKWTMLEKSFEPDISDEASLMQVIVASEPINGSRNTPSIVIDDFTLYARER